MLQTETVNTFIIEMVLIDPIEKIIKKLNNNDFRDCDIKWLDEKIHKFISFAAETLGITGLNVPSDDKGKIMNDYVKNIYLSRFNNLLQYFKNLNN